MLQRLPRLLLAAGLVLHGFAFTWLLALRHARFATFDFDLGIFDQNVWLLSQGKSFLTVRGLEVFGHHASFGHFLFVPFYWLGAGPDFLNTAMVVSVAIAAVVVFRLASRMSESEWIGLALALGFAVHPTTTWLLQETYHPEVMAIAPLFLAFEAAGRERFRTCALWLALAISFKEDIALAGLALGFLVALRGQRRVGLAIGAASLAWFVFVLELLLPRYTPGGAFFQEFYSHLGETPVEVVTGILTSPATVLEHLAKADAVGYLVGLADAYGFTPLLSPLPLLLGLPQFAANLLSQHSFTWSLRLHYAALVLAAMTLAMVEGVCRRRSPVVRHTLAVLVLVCATATTLLRGIGPGSRDFRAGYWPLVEQARTATLARAVSLPGPDDVVSASYTIVPHLTHRERVYRFPNPWWSAGWGVNGEDMHSPEAVEWIVLDKLLLGEEDRGLYRHLRSSKADWAVVLAEDDVVVLRRRR